MMKNSIIDKIINFDAWVAPSLRDLAMSMNDRLKNTSGERTSWRNFKNELSPLTTYKYLKGRFGFPNGIAMIAKTPSVNNIIHWHYTINIEEVEINFWGHSSGLEITFSSLPQQLSDVDRKIFIDSLKKDFQKYGGKFKEASESIEQWTLFINPFVRLYQTIHPMIDELEEIETEFKGKDVHEESSSMAEYYQQSLIKWTESLNKAAGLGTTIRMLYPVMLESFINLIIYLLRKVELRENVRLYENTVRQYIDIRVMSLHLVCDGFKKAIDSSDERFRAFQTLMNGRNDFLHGNIDPFNISIDKFFMDQENIPLYQEDGGIIRRIMPKYCANVTKEDVWKDEQIVSGFMELVLESLEDESFRLVLKLMDERFPGYNNKTGKIGIILPQDYAEGYALAEQKIEEDSRFQWFVDSNGVFEIYIPVSWKYFRNEGKHYFREYEDISTEQLIVTVRQLENDSDFKTHQAKFGNLQKVSFQKNTFSVVMSGVSNGTVIRSWTALLDNTILLFTYSTPDKVAPEFETLTVKQKLNRIEKVLGSFNLIGERDCQTTINTYQFSQFIKGIASVSFLLKNAFDTKSYFEASCLILSQVSALLRVAIIFKTQINGQTKIMELYWMLPDGNPESKSIEKVFDQALLLGIVGEELFDKLILSKSRCEYFFNNFIRDNVIFSDVKQHARKMYEELELVGDILAGLEAELVAKGLEFTEFHSPNDKRIYAEHIKSKIGKFEYSE